MTDPAVYQAYVNRNTPIAAAAGGRFITRGENLSALDGAPPKRFSIQVFDNMDQAQAYRSSAAYQEIKPMRDKSSKFRSFLAEGSVTAQVGN